MKKCPYCAEEIQNEATKCKHCGEFLNKPKDGATAAPKGKWYHNNASIAFAFFCVGPLALPLVWFHPKYSRMAKVILTIVSLVLTYIFTVMFLQSMHKIIDQYKQLSAAMQP